MEIWIFFGGKPQKIAWKCCGILAENPMSRPPLNLCWLIIKSKVFCHSTTHIYIYISHTRIIYHKYIYIYIIGDYHNPWFRIPLKQQYFVGQCRFPNKILLLIVRFYWPIKGKSYQSMIGIAFNKVGHQFATRAATASVTNSWGGTPGLVPLQEDGELLEKLKAAGALWPI